VLRFTVPRPVMEPGTIKFVETLWIFPGRGTTLHGL
jgi:hypothetical protein